MISSDSNPAMRSLKSSGRRKGDVAAVDVMLMKIRGGRSFEVVTLCCAVMRTGGGGSGVA